MDIDKIRKRKLIYENGKKLLLEKYATNPTLEKQIEETNLVLDTLDFCLYCIGDANQYTAVVAQNKSLQGELNIYKIMTKNLIMLKAGEYSKYHQTFTKFKIQALQELEAEND